MKATVTDSLINIETGSGRLAKLQKIVAASLDADPVIRNTTDQETQAVLDRINAAIAAGGDNLALSHADMHSLKLVLTAMAALDSIPGVADEDVETLEREIWEIPNGTSGPG